MIRTAILSIGLASFGWAQLRVPVAGYVIDPASTLVRPIIGAPGAALIGGSLAPLQSATYVAISPDQQYAILSGNQLTVAAIGPDGFVPSTTIEGAINSPDRIEFSAGGSAAALYSAKLAKIQIVTGLPVSPQVVREFAFGDELLALALAGDAGTLVTANSDGNVSLLARDGSTRLVASAGSIVALQFLPDASRAIAIDRAGNRVLLLSGLPDSPAVQVLQDKQGGVDSPAAVQVTADGRRALIANSGGHNILSVNLDTKDAVAIACAFRPAFLQSLPNGTFLVSDEDHKRIWMLDPVASRVLFVPAIVQ